MSNTPKCDAALARLAEGNVFPPALSTDSLIALTDLLEEPQRSNIREKLELRLKVMGPQG